MKEKLLVFSRFINLISLFVFVWLTYKLFASNLIPRKYIFLILVVLGIFELIYIFVCFKKTKKVLLIILDVLAVLFMTFEIYGIFKLDDTITFIKKSTNIEYAVDTYYVVVNKNSNYNNIKDIDGKKIYYYDKNIDTDKVKNVFKKNSKAILTKEQDYGVLFDNIINNSDYIVLLHSSNYESIIDIDENYSNVIKEIYKIEIKSKKKQIKKKNSNLLEKPFIIYISGIDTRNDYMPERSRSDVNMIAVVNPITNKVLLINTPRDYYVQLHGTTGLKDKLTHAGIIGGVELSKATLEDLYEVKIDNHMRVNFNAVVKLVDLVGGITVNSDVDYSFTCHTDKNCKINPGNNNVDGKCALAFSRERYAYQSGDRHRGENQQQVISVLIDKITKSGKILSKYSDILKALEGSFETSLTMDDITNLIKYQLDENPTWKVEKISADGEGLMTVTNSYPTRPLWVMVQDDETIEAAKQKIKEIMTER